MILQKIELENFRSFYGNQELIFSDDAKKNITLVQGENGTGKTALLNALIWAFHGYFTGNFNNPEMLVNKFAIRNDNCNSCKVTIFFKFKGNEYRLIREFNNNTTKSVLSVFEIDSKKNNTPVPNKEQFVNQVFPRGMAKYFFFDGEFATNFEKETSKSDAKKAINDILGATAAKHALQDISILKNNIHAEIKAKTVNTKIVRLENTRAEKMKTLEQKQNRKRDIPNERQIEKTKADAADQILLTHSETARIKERCNKLENDLDNIINDISLFKSQKTAWITQNAIYLVSKTIATKCKAIYDEMAKKVQIPAPYHLEFVEGLIESKVCICGRELEKHSPAYRAVHELLSNAPDSKISRDMINIRSFCDTTINHNADTKSLIKIDTLINNAHQREIEKRTELEIAKKQILSVTNLNLAEQSRISIHAKHKIGSLNAEEIGINNTIQELAAEIKSIDNQIKTLSVNDSVVVKLQKQLKFLTFVESHLSNTITQLEDSALDSLRVKTNELLSNVFRQNITVNITKNYELSLRDADNNVAPASGGQGLLASLAFLACLIKFCADRESDDSVILSPGTIAPFVLDAPFGQLDPKYRQSAARFLQDYSSQLVLFLSTSHGDPETIKIIENNIGSRAILIAENIASQPLAQNKKIEIININGFDHITTLWDCNIDTTTIKSIEG